MTKSLEKPSKPTKISQIHLENKLIEALNEFEKLDPESTSRTIFLKIWKSIYPLHTVLVNSDDFKITPAKPILTRFHRARKFIENTYHFTEHNQFIIHKSELSQVIHDAISRFKKQNNLKPFSIVNGISLHDLSLESGLSKSVVESYCDANPSLNQELEVISTTYKLNKLKSYVEFLSEYIKYNQKQNPRLHSHALTSYKSLVDFHASWQPLFEQHGINTASFDKAYANLNEIVPDEFKNFGKELPKVPLDETGKPLPRKYKPTNKNQLARQKVLGFLKDLEENPHLLPPIKRNLRSAFNVDFAKACGVKLNRLILASKEAPDFKTQIEDALEQHYYNHLLLYCQEFPVKAKQYKEASKLAHEYHKCKNHVLFTLRVYGYTHQSPKALNKLLNNIESSYNKALAKLKAHFEDFDPSLPLQFKPNPYSESDALANYKAYEKAVDLAHKLHDKTVEILQQEKTNPTDTSISLTRVYKAINEKVSNSTARKKLLVDTHNFIKLAEQQRRIDRMNYYLNNIKKNPSEYIDQYGYYIDLKRLLGGVNMRYDKYFSITDISLDDLFANMDEVQGVLLEARHATS